MTGSPGALASILRLGAFRGTEHWVRASCCRVEPSDRNGLGCSELRHCLKLCQSDLLFALVKFWGFTCFKQVKPHPIQVGTFSNATTNQHFYFLSALTLAAAAKNYVRQRRGMPVSGVKRRRAKTDCRQMKVHISRTVRV